MNKIVYVTPVVKVSRIESAYPFLDTSGLQTDINGWDTDLVSGTAD